MAMTMSKTRKHFDIDDKVVTSAKSVDKDKMVQEVIFKLAVTMNARLLASQQWTLARCCKK